jgi:hypothetical protein
MMKKPLAITLHILYGGLRYENEYYSFKYKSSRTEKIVF